MSRHHKYQVTDNHDRINNTSPHDVVFKTFMFIPETGRGFSRNTFTKTTAQALQPATLRLKPTSFIEKSLRAYYSDVLVGAWKPATVTAISTA
ncbi:Rpn family recombination-promoting nuclease/putative transposase [Shigella flexneri]